MIRALQVIHNSPARRNAAGSLKIQASQRLARVATLVAAAAILDPIPFAALAIALALTDLVRAALLAYDVSAVRLLSSGGDPGSILGSHLGAKIVVGIGGTLAILTLSTFAYGQATTVLVLVASLGTLPYGVASLLLVRRQVAFQLGSAAPMVIAGSFGGAAAALVGLVVSHEPLAVSMGLVAGDVLVLAVLAAGLRNASPVPAAEIGAVIRRTWTLLVMQLAYIGEFRAGAIVLGAAGAAVAVGEYTVASRVAEGMVILAAALTASSLPLMGSAFGRGDHLELAQTVGRAYRLSLMAAAPPVALLALSAPVWVAVVFPRYPGAAQTFLPVGLTVIIYFASTQTTAFLNASHRDRLAALSASLGLAAAAAGSWWLAAAGAIGVALARLVGESLRLSIETAAIVKLGRYVTGSMVTAWVSIAPFVVVIVMLAILGWSPPLAVAGVAVTLATGAVAMRQQGIA
jgi:O-antigen/teichoic acid export membrane protein